MAWLNIKRLVFLLLVFVLVFITVYRAISVTDKLQNTYPEEFRGIKLLPETETQIDRMVCDYSINVTRCLEDAGLN